jgi:hypothetical protein
LFINLIALPKQIPVIIASHYSRLTYGTSFFQPHPIIINIIILTTSPDNNVDQSSSVRPHEHGISAAANSEWNGTHRPEHKWEQKNQ